MEGVALGVWLRLVGTTQLRGIRIIWIIASGSCTLPLWITTVNAGSLVSDDILGNLPGISTLRAFIALDLLNLDFGSIFLLLLS